MKKLVIVAMFVVAGSVSTAQASTKADPTEIYISVGAAFPVSNLNARYTVGYNGSIGVGFKLWRDIHVVPEFEVQTFKLDHRAFRDSVSGGDYVAVLTGADFRLFDGSGRWPIDPIVLIGGGIAVASVSQINLSNVYIDPYNDAKFYLDVGIGLDVRLTGAISGFALTRYVRMSSGISTDQYFPFSVGVKVPI